MKSLVPALALALALPACGDTSSSASAPLVRDSAGIQIVENATPAWHEADAWRIAVEPTLEIGMVQGDPEYQLFEVTGVTRLTDGRIVVANAGTHQLRYFDGAGSYLKDIGGEGEGPGEFTGLYGLSTFAGDFIAAWDYQLKRLSIFDPTGTFIRSSSPPELTGFAPNVQAVFDDGAFVASSGFDPGLIFASGTGVRSDSVDYLIFAADGTVVDTVGRFAGQENYAVTTESSVRIVPLPFGRETFTSTDGDRLYVASGDRFEVAVYDPGSGLVRLIRLPSDRKSVTEADIDRYRETSLSSITDPNRRRQQEEMLSMVPFPEQLPAVVGLEVDGEGNVWVADAQHPGEGTPTWTVFDPQGMLLGKVVIPEGLSLQEIGSDYILGLWTDDFEVQHVRLYELEKP